MANEFERYIGQDGRVWVRMSVDEYWRRITDAATPKED